MGLDPARVTPLGYLDPYLTGTGFLIVPTVAVVAEPLCLTLNAIEVDEAFEVPLAFLMEAANHQRGSRLFNGSCAASMSCPMPSGASGVSRPGLIRNLYEKLYS